MKKLFFIETETKHTKHENFDKVLKTKEIEGASHPTGKLLFES